LNIIVLTNFVASNFVGFVERVAAEQNEVKGDTSIPAYAPVDADFGNNEDWDEEVGRISFYFCHIQCVLAKIYIRC